MKIYPNKTEQENLLLLIKEVTHVELTDADVTIGTPTAHALTTVTDPSNPNAKPLGHDTQVRLTAKDTSPKYTGSHAVNYRRINLETQWLVINGTVEVLYTPSLLATFDEAHIKEFIINRCSYKTESIQITVNINANAATATVTPIDNSLLYTGKLILSFKPKPKEKLDLDTVITEDNLDGFEYNTEAHAADVTLDGFKYPKI